MRRRSFLKSLLTLIAAPAVLAHSPSLPAREALGFTWDAEDGPTYDHVVEVFDSVPDETTYWDSEETP